MGEAEEAEEEDKKPPPQIEASCTCRWCCKWTVCEHTALVASVFSPKYKVPGKLIAATPALRKKTNSVRGLAGLRRKRALMEIRQQKAKSTSKLTYMDQPVPRRPMQPSAAAPQPSADPKHSFVVPSAVNMPPSDDEVLIDFLSPCLILTVARARLSRRFSRLLLSQRLHLRPQSGAGSSARPTSALLPVSRLGLGLSVQSHVRVVIPALPAHRNAPSTRVMCLDPKNDLPMPQGSDRRKVTSTSSGRRGGPK